MISVLIEVYYYEEENKPRKVQLAVPKRLLCRMVACVSRLSSEQTTRKITAKHSRGHVLS